MQELQRYSQGLKTKTPWANALRIAANERTPEGLRKLRLIAQKTVEMALAGNLEAIKIIGDRLDGKPSQSTAVAITHTHNLALSDGQLAELVERFERKMLEGTPVVEIDGSSEV